MSRIVRSVAAFVVLVAVSLPAAAQAPRIAAVGTPFGLRLGGEAAIRGTDVVVRFDRVIDDSRCPVDVTCVWAGVFRMVLVVDIGGAAPVEVELDTMGAEGTAAGLHFVLLRVKPVRYALVGSGDPAPYYVLIRADRVQ